MNRGFVILADNTPDTDYVKCATALAKSLKRTMPTCSVTIMTSQCDLSKNELFDNVIVLPQPSSFRDRYNTQADCYAYTLSPYEYTIKLEADMYIPQDISYWWDVLKHRDLVVSTTIRNYHQHISNERYYRRFIDQNKLPDCYNAITYFKKSNTATYFFNLVEFIFENWPEFRATLQCKVDEPATTDWVYAIACHIMGVENTTLPLFKEMSMVHMKQAINHLKSEDWTRELVYEIFPHTLRVNTVPQKYPFHYHVKSFCDNLL